MEIADAAGKDNEIIFGMLTPEVNALKGMGYHPQAFISDDNVAMAVLDMLEKGWNGENFSEVTNNLRNSDPYMVLADFKDYRRAQHTVQELYKQKQTWNRMSLMNISTPASSPPTVPSWITPAISGALPRLNNLPKAEL